MTLDLSKLKNFLQNTQLKEVPKTTRGSSINTKPIVGDIKISRNGRIFLSDALLAMMTKTVKVTEENGEETTKVEFVKGLDFIDSRKWSMYPEDAEQHLVFCCLTNLEDSKLCSRVDVRKETDSSVGFTAVREVVIPLLIDLYGLDPDFSWIELSIDFETALSHSSEIYMIPKIGSKGEDKGKVVFKRRENTKFWPVLLTDDLVKDDGEEENAAELETEKDTSIIIDSTD